MLPVVVPPTTVDLSRVDPGLVAYISSFLGTSQELISLGLTCRSFGWRQSASTRNWSFVEEVARQALCSRATAAEMDSLPQYLSGTTTWLSILYRFEHILDLDVLLGGYNEHRNGDKATVYGTGPLCTAVSSIYVMRTGSHFAEFEIINGSPYIGIVRPMPNLDAAAYAGKSFFSFFRRALYPDFVAQRLGHWGDGSVNACKYDCGDGLMTWADWDGEDIGWEGWNGMEESVSGDTIGLLLNLDDGTLTVYYKNNRRLGVMKDGLSGPYCWYAEVTGGNTVYH